MPIEMSVVFICHTLPQLPLAVVSLGSGVCKKSVACLVIQRPGRSGLAFGISRTKVSPMIAMQRSLVALGIILGSLAPALSDPLPECVVRAGLPNVFTKLETGKIVRLAYLGGSITAQEGWRPK